MRIHPTSYEACLQWKELSLVSTIRFDYEISRSIETYHELCSNDTKTWEEVYEMARCQTGWDLRWNWYKRFQRNRVSKSSELRNWIWAVPWRILKVVYSVYLRGADSQLSLDLQIMVPATCPVSSHGALATGAAAFSWVMSPSLWTDTLNPEITFSLNRNGYHSVNSYLDPWSTVTALRNNPIARQKDSCIHVIKAAFSINLVHNRYLGLLPHCFIQQSLCFSQVITPLQWICVRNWSGPVGWLTHTMLSLALEWQNIRPVAGTVLHKNLGNLPLSFWIF